MARKPLKICLATAEMTPLAKTGGLADVAAALTAYFDAQGHDVRTLMPFHSAIDASKLDLTPVHFLQNRPLQLGRHHFRYSIDTATLPGNCFSNCLQAHSNRVNHPRSLPPGRSGKRSAWQQKN